MAVTIERPRTGVAATVERWVYESPLWVLGVATLTFATLLHGYEWSTAMPATEKVVADPFTQDFTTGAWMYQSPLGPMICWVLGLTAPAEIGLVSYAITFISVLVACAAVARWVSDYAARLFLLAYWCSPQSWAGTAYLGLFDIITVAGLSVCFVAPAGVCFAAGVVLGFNHFEQAGFALVAIAVVRIVMRRESHMPMVFAFAGLVAGKAILMWYLVSSGIETNGRLDFIRDRGLANIIRGWRGYELTLMWAALNVLWVGVVWMLYTMGRRDRWLTVGLFVFLTLPVLITYDLSRVYRTVTWPLVMLLVVYASEWTDRRLARRVSLLLAVAAVFVPRTELWYGGTVLN